MRARGAQQQPFGSQHRLDNTSPSQQHSGSPRAVKPASSGARAAAVAQLLLSRSTAHGRTALVALVATLALLVLALTASSRWNHHQPSLLYHQSAAHGPPPITLLSTAAAHSDGDARAAALATAPPLHVTIRLPGAPRPLPFPSPSINDALLRAVVEECAKRQETYILVAGTEGAVVASTDFFASVSSRRCPPVDIMLAAEHRSIGL